MNKAATLCAKCCTVLPFSPVIRKHCGSKSCELQVYHPISREAIPAEAQPVIPREQGHVFLLVELRSHATTEQLTSGLPKLTTWKCQNPKLRLAVRCLHP